MLTVTARSYALQALLTFYRAALTVTAAIALQELQLHCCSHSVVQERQQQERTRISPQSTQARNLVSARGSKVNDHRNRQISSFSSAFKDLHAHAS